MQNPEKEVGRAVAASAGEWLKGLKKLWKSERLGEFWRQQDWGQRDERGKE